MEGMNMNDRTSNYGNLTPELLSSVEQYIRENYVPKVEEAAAVSERVGSTRPSGSYRQKEGLERKPEKKRWEPEYGKSSIPEDIGWKEAEPEEEADELFDARRIELEEGKPVLSSPSKESARRRPSSDAPRGLDEIVMSPEETFSERLFHLIDEKGFTDADVYKRAHIDRKLFSKIRSKNYTPRKRNVIALALALRLNPDEASDLLRRAGMALSPSSKADLIAEYCIRNGIYDINVVNELLDRYGEPVLS